MGNAGSAAAMFGVDVTSPGVVDDVTICHVMIRINEWTHSTHSEIDTVDFLCVYDLLYDRLDSL